jgi:hypothetical protein
MSANNKKRKANAKNRVKNKNYTGEVSITAKVSDQYATL